MPYGGGRQPAVLRTFSQRLSRGFNDAVNGFLDDGWSLMSSDGAEDVTIAINSSPNKLVGSHVSSSQLFSAIGGGVLCAKASMLLQVSTHTLSMFSFSINSQISCWCYVT
jgi:homeobox-leucine zipper protein